MFAFTLSISQNNLNVALIYLTATLIFWVLFGLLLDAFDVQIFAWIISASGFVVAISVFFMYAIEEVPYPVGALVFHSGGFASALGIGLFSLFPILILRQISGVKILNKVNMGQTFTEKEPEPEIISEEWEQASEDDLQSGEFMMGN